ncbi:MAG: methyltransferase domain-containing protein [Elusimicrobia bacterium]|nr:methyltransferase domain-containing protein [Elusimicrobiota bacterium]
MLTAVAVAAVSLQALAMAADEFVFHRGRRLGAFESWGHVADSLVYLLPLAVAAAAPPGPFWRGAFVASAALSCALITKDEWIHAAECPPAEHWLHSALFVLHPCVLLPVGLLWVRGEAAPLRALLPLAVAVFAAHQAVYWLVLGHRRPDEPARVNNAFYGELGALWHEGDGHAIALLRAETRERLAYLRESFAREGVRAGARVLDVGCGGGLVSNALAAEGYRVKGVDAAEGALASARARVPAGAEAVYAAADAYALPEPDGAFDAVLLLDVLEHFEEPARAVAEAARVLRPGGLLVIRPRVFHLPFWASLLRRRVHPDFAFTRSSSLAAGYLACFAKRASC